ncbi:xanthosine utilization system XapX-like protein [Microbacterium resistens]|uniref:Xanthosine utilization system XapX-like protein n=1 Tax=Microbacterium resistens TaxID=156977 RepID=A0ABU1S7G8_9MICO|nr:general stress protein [Microbacterium resistens]MDR6865536.1 xanthosine utilization system XapX-like protein [Microbacterium resistens]
MSMMNRPAGSAEVGETVASVREYEAAQKLVSKLIAGEVPAREIAIVGMGVRTIERVTGRLGYATAARSGAMNGLLIGLFLSAIFVLGNPAAPIQAFVGVLFVGVAMGMILSLVTYAIVRRRRDYASVMQLAADHYEVTVLPSSLSKARQVLGAAPTPARPAAASASPTTTPPRYGERVAPGASGAPARTAAPGAPAAPVADRQAPTTPATSTPSAQEPPRYGERIAPPPPARSAAEAAAAAVPVPTVSAPEQPAADAAAPETAAPETVVQPEAPADAPATERPDNGGSAPRP